MLSKPERLVLHARVTASMKPLYQQVDCGKLALGYRIAAGQLSIQIKRHPGQDAIQELTQKGANMVICSALMATLHSCI